MEVPKSLLGECKKPSGICSNQETLQAIADKVEVHTKSGPAIVNAAKKATGCNSELCVVRKLVDNADDVIKRHWKPHGPRGMSWLSNVHIDNVLEWWEDEHDFVHIPFACIDFMKTGEPLARMSIPTLASKRKPAACVINTDVRSGTGKHWFCLFINPVTPDHVEIEYFNSSGNNPMVEILEYITECKRSSEPHGIDVALVVASTMRHQYSDSECGPYSLYYLWSRLKGIDHDVFGRRHIKDSEMTRFRSAVFRSEK